MRMETVTDALEQAEVTADRDDDQSYNKLYLSLYDPSDFSPG